GADRVVTAHAFQHAVDGRRGGGQQQDALAASGRLGDDLGDHARLAGHGEALDQAQVGGAQGAGHGVALAVVQVGVGDGDGGDADRCQGGGLAGEEGTEDGDGGRRVGGRRVTAAVGQGGKLVGVEQALAAGQGQQLHLLGRGGTA